MHFTLKDIVPWGRTPAEYAAMFALSDADYQRRILGCGDGPAAFNAGVTKQGGRVVSVDPLYRFSAEEIRKRIGETYAEVMAQTRANREEFIWTTISSVDELGRIRLAAMEDFLADYPRGLQEKRYVAGALPRLSFADASFDLALCSHLLFLYSEQLSGAFHLDAIRELCRVAAEVRIFPLLELGAKPSRHLQAVKDGLAGEGYAVSVEPVPYEFQKGGNRMMRVTRGAGV